MHKLAALDQQYVWHPFTQMREWLSHEPTVIESGRGALLRDAHGREGVQSESQPFVSAVVTSSVPRLGSVIVTVVPLSAVLSMVMVPP